MATSASWSETQDRGVRSGRRAAGGGKERPCRSFAGFCGSCRGPGLRQKPGCRFPPKRPDSLPGSILRWEDTPPPHDGPDSTARSPTRNRHPMTPSRQGCGGLTDRSFQPPCASCRGDAADTGNHADGKGRLWRIPVSAHSTPIANSCCDKTKVQRNAASHKPPFPRQCGNGGAQNRLRLFPGAVLRELSGRDPFKPHASMHCQVVP